MNLFTVWRLYDATKSVIDSEKLYAFAVAWGTWRGQQYLRQEMEERSRLTSYDATNPDMDEPRWAMLPCRLPTPEEAFFNDEEERVARLLIEETPVEERRRWLDPLLEGETERAQAAREGVRQQSVNERRQRGVRRCRRRFVELGWSA